MTARVEPSGSDSSDPSGAQQSAPQPNSTGNDWPECPTGPDLHPQVPQYGPSDPRAPHCRHDATEEPSIPGVPSLPPSSSTVPGTGFCTQQPTYNCYTYRFGGVKTNAQVYAEVWQIISVPTNAVAVNSTQLQAWVMITPSANSWDQIGWAVGHCGSTFPVLWTQYMDAGHQPQDHCYGPGQPNTSWSLTPGQNYAFASLYLGSCTVQNQIYYNGSWQLVDTFYATSVCTRGNANSALEFYNQNSTSNGDGPGWPSTGSAVSFANGNVAACTGCNYVPWDTNVPSGYDNSADTLSYGQTFTTFWSYFTETPGVSPNFGISASPSSLSPLVGSSATSNITLSPNSAFESHEMGNVSLSVGGLPSGDSVSWSGGTNVYLAENTPSSNNLTFNIGSPQSFTATVTACADPSFSGICRSATVSVNPVAPNFDISITQPSGLVPGTVLPGTSGTATVYVYGSSSFSGTVCLTTSSGGGPVSVSPTCVGVSSGQTSTATVTVSTSLLQLSDYTVSVTGTGSGGLAGVSRTAYATVHPLPLL